MTILRVDLRCPSCHHAWHAATIDTASWWGKGVKPEAAAKACHCVRCSQCPPMTVVEPQGELFANEATT